MTSIENKEEIIGEKCAINHLVEFNDLNLSEYTLSSLTRLGFRKLTSIQKISIPPALRGFDVLGSARTGSGKTLCFIVPIIEILWVKKWSKEDSIGSCIICPTRELAIQLFDFAKSVSKQHSLEIGIIIGGKQNIKENKKKSIISSTPGCLFRHLLNNKLFNLDSLKILAFDEADKILDSSFWKIINIMSKFLPKKKQILLFSATLNPKVRNVARLNLKNPIFCSLSTKNKTSVEPTLKKFQVDFNQTKHFVVFLYDYEKINYLFSFLRSHKTQKIIIFISTRKQVKFFSEIFKVMCPDFLIFNTYGSMNQNKRIYNFLKFNQYTRGFLFSTDLTSRGLDFRSVDWIIQLDCPQTIESYIHRVGRTGRFLEKGKAILFLDYSESKFINKLREKLINIYQVKFNKKHIISIENKLRLLLKNNNKCLTLAQNAFISYARLVYFQKKKEYSDFNKLNWKKFASNLGLTCDFLQNYFS
jgi:ATP-dependent RNA helicase DDX10/DBP4